MYTGVAQVYIGVAQVYIGVSCINVLQVYIYRCYRCIQVC